MTLHSRFGSVALLVLFLLLASSALAQDSDEFDWSVTPYFWASDTSLDLTVEDTDINGGVKSPFSDLLDILVTDFTFSGPMAGFNFRF